MYPVVHTSILTVYIYKIKTRFLSETLMPPYGGVCEGYSFSNANETKRSRSGWWDDDITLGKDLS